jgi:hypothetical protein
MNLERITPFTGTPPFRPIGTMLLAQLADISERSLSPETARKLLELSIDRSHQVRVTALSKKAQEGTLTPGEDHELYDYIRVADLLAILQSKSRRALKRTHS